MLRYLGLCPRLSLFERFALFLNVKMNFDDPITPNAKRWDTHNPYFRNMGMGKGPPPKIVPMGQMKNMVVSKGNNDCNEFHPVPFGTNDWFVGVPFFPQMNLRASGIPSLQDGFFLPSLFPRKRGGQGVSLRELANRCVRHERKGILHLFLCALCVCGGFKKHQNEC